MDKPRIVIVSPQDKLIGHKERSTLAQEDIYRVAGTVDEGETYDSNIVKEAEEEIGLQAIQPIKSKKRRYTGAHNYFCQWYTLVVDKPVTDFTLQEEEVAQVKWFTRAELEKELREHPENYLKGLDWAVEALS